MGVESISDVLASFVENTTLADIPAETVEFTKSLALKTLAGMVAGSATNASKPLVQYALQDVGVKEAGVLGCGFSSSIERAILANGHFCHAAELEDDQFPSVTSDITVFPVIFPMAEKFKLTGKEVVEASAVGIEVMNRVGMYSLAYRGMTDLAFFGVIGGAVTAAKALKLNKEQIANAIGIAIGRAGGYITNFGTDAHYLESSMACRDGYFAAIMAQKGLTGTTNIEGWLKQLHDRQDLNVGKIVEGIGKDRWYVHNIWIKKYPCCFLTHRQIDMMLQMKQNYGLTPENINYVEIDAGPVDVTCDRPNPKHVEDSRFSFQHIMSAILIDGDIGYSSFTDAKIASPEFSKLREKVKVVHRKDWPAEFNSGIARVAVSLKNNVLYEEKLEQPLGGAKRPLSEEQFVDLYRKYTRNFLGEKAIAETSKSILTLEKVGDISKLMNVLVHGK